jgi:hypothetical protein
MKPLRVASLVLSAIVAGALLQWAAIVVYGYAASALAAQRVVTAPGSVFQTLVLIGVFATPSFAAGAVTARVVPRHQFAIAALVGLSAAGFFAFQLAAAGFSFTGLLLGPAPLALIIGAVAGVLVGRHVLKKA